MSDDYDKLLDNVYRNLPEKLTSGERFEPPKFEIFSEGNKTIIKNFQVVAEKLRRDKAFLIKYLSKELAAPAVETGDRLVLHTKVNYDTLAKKLEEFISKYVMCKECNRPDTNIKDMGHTKMLVCEACGATRPIK
ncbi:MAG: translation initiation factor IF-2 subunit beta [Candidatus Bilamarchaeaceae archaeon]